MTIKDITGKRFGRLTAVRCVGTRETESGPRAVWLFSCDCGGAIERPAKFRCPSSIIGCQDCKSSRLSSIRKKGFRGRERDDISAEELRTLLDYDPETGAMRWRVSSGAMRAGEAAGMLDERSGYIRIVIGRVPYSLHRLAFMWMLGRWPVDQVDHRNRNKTDNRWANLRDATHSQNQANKGVTRRNATGLKGVYRAKDRPNRWFSAINKDRRTYRVGSFDCPAAAYLAYIVKSNELFAEFACHE